MKQPATHEKEVFNDVAHATAELQTIFSYRTAANWVQKLNASELNGVFSDKEVMELMDSFDEFCIENNVSL